MTTSEPGPELDRRVAEVMSVKPTCVRRYLHSKPPVYMFPDYSTDPARIAEMVEWLYGRIPGVTLDCVRGEVASRGGPGGRFFNVSGRTIQHALALLVVAVGENG